MLSNRKIGYLSTMLSQVVMSLVLSWSSTNAAIDRPIDGLSAVKWKTGQIVGTSEASSDPTTFIFEILTGTRFGHIGVVSVEGEEVFVYEGNPPVASKTPLKAFLDRAHSDPKTGLKEVAVVEPIRDLTADEQEALRKTAADLVAQKTPYNFDMISEPGRLNCSEFIRAVYQGIGFLTQASQKVQDLNVNAFGGQFVALWESKRKTKVDLNAEIISPAAIINSTDMKLVHATVPVGRLQSEREILDAWNADNSLALFEALLGLPTGTGEMMKQIANTEPYRTYPGDWRKERATRASFTASAPPLAAPKCLETLKPK